jgi:uncharacterized HAD superfamily protein
MPLKDLKAKKDNINLSLNSLKSKSKEDVIRLILSQNELFIPATVFSTKISPLTALTKYLHQNMGMPTKEIAARLNRHEQTIYTILHLAKKGRLKIKPTKTEVPLSIFAKERLSILETITHYLKDENKISFTEISNLLHKSVKTIWTCYSRYRTKEEIK